MPSFLLYFFRLKTKKFDYFKIFLFSVSENASAVLSFYESKTNKTGKLKMKKFFTINKFSIIIRIFMFAGTLSGTKAVLSPAHKNNMPDVIKMIRQIKPLPDTGSMNVQHDDLMTFIQKTTIPYNQQQDEKQSTARK